jgi:hypothetical protein
MRFKVIDFGEQIAQKITLQGCREKNEGPFRKYAHRRMGY